MPAPVPASITQTLADAVSRDGVYAVFAIMALDALLPAGGELTMLVAGAVAGGALGVDPALVGHTLSTGLESFLVLAAAGTLGYVCGALVGWGVGRWGGRPLLERHGRWLRVDANALGRADRWFDRHGRAAVFLGRLTPVVRSFISYPAGVTGIPLVPYTVLTLAGSALWCLAFAGAGWALGSHYGQVHHAFTGVEILIVAGAVIVVGAVFVRRRMRRAARL
jgi:membrane protein DedA with SNARE-associated domain